MAIHFLSQNRIAKDNVKCFVNITLTSFREKTVIYIAVIIYNCSVIEQYVTRMKAQLKIFNPKEVNLDTLTRKQNVLEEYGKQIT